MPKNRRESLIYTVLMCFTPSLPLVNRKSELFQLRFSSVYALFPVFTEVFLF